MVIGVEWGYGQYLMASGGFGIFIGAEFTSSRYQANCCISDVQNRIVIISSLRETSGSEPT